MTLTFKTASRFLLEKPFSYFISKQLHVMRATCKFSGGFRAITSHSSKDHDPTVSRSVAIPRHQGIIVRTGIGERWVARPASLRVHLVHDRLTWLGNEMEAQRLDQTQRPLVIEATQQDE